MSPTCAKLLGILSMKNGRPVLRWMRVCARYCSPNARSSSAENLSERARIRGAVGARRPPADDARDHRDVRQLLRALDLRMRGEDLLDERGARARQPHHEDRIAARGSPCRGARRRTPRVKSFFERATCASLSSAS